MRSVLQFLGVGVLVACASCRQDEPTGHPQDQPKAGVFTADSFDDAKQRAARADKLVFVDFYATWCVPCKILDDTTLKDTKVVQWLKENTVGVKIDSDRDQRLATRFAVESLPTLLFCKPDGTEIGRILGAVSAEDFLKEARQIRAGKSSIDIARQELTEAGENDPMARMRFADRLAQQGKHAEALEAYLWCYDEGTKHNPAFVGVRSSFLVSSIARLSAFYPPTRTALQQRRDAAEEELLASASRKPSMWSMIKKVMSSPERDYASLNASLGEADKTLAMYDRLRSEYPDASALDALRQAVLDQLRQARRYTEIADACDIEAQVKEQIQASEMGENYLPPDISDAQKEQIKEVNRRRLLAQIVASYEILIGIQAEDRAARLADEALSIDESASTYNALAWAGFLTGAPTAANEAQARKAYEMTYGRDIAIADTLIRILHSRGNAKEACDLLQKHAQRKISTQFQGVITDLQRDLACS